MSDLVDTAPLASAALRQRELFPIREVARLTGVNPVTLRAWERRYGLIQPVRTDSGHRLYSLSDVETVRSVLAWIERGVPVSKAGELLNRSVLLEPPVGPSEPAEQVEEWQQCQARLEDAMQAFDDRRLARAYGQALADYPLSVAFQDIIMPLWQRLLLRHDRLGCGSEWLFLDTFLRARVAQRLHHNREQTPARLLLLALPGRCRELELLVAALQLDPQDAAVQVLGIGQSLEELQHICERVKPRVVVLFSNQPPTERIVEAVQRTAMRVDCPLAVAGECAELLREPLTGTSIACLGSDGRLMKRRLQQLVAGRLDT